MKTAASLLLSLSLASGSFAVPAIGQDTGEIPQISEAYQTKKYQKKYNNITELMAPTPVVQDYEPNPAIWKLADDDTTIYMFGTFHLLPDSFRWRSAAFDAVVERSDELVVETASAEGDAEIAAFMMELVVKTLSDDTPTVSERLSEENRSKWLSLAKSTGAPEAYFDKMPLVLSLMGIGAQYTVEQGSSFENGVETVLEAEFAEAGKPIGSIEDAMTVFKSILALDEDLLIKDLDRDLAEWDGFSIGTLVTPFSEAPATGKASDTGTTESDGALSGDPFAMEHAWARGEASKLGIDEFGGSEFGKLLYEKLLTDRNRAWAEWLDERLDRPGTILLAVGAGHFEGKDSVQEMLEERGLSAERIH